MPEPTFLFTDIEGSTRLWERHPEDMQEALSEHDRLADATVREHGGRVFKHMGDGVAAVFESPASALTAAAEFQRRLRDSEHPVVGVLGVRMGIHRGEAEQRGEDFFGLSVTRAARIMSAGHGGQILVSSAATDETHDLRDLGEHRLRDLTGTERIYQLVGDGLPEVFPPLRTLEVAPNNLPTLPTSFVGRERELAEVRELIRTARLVTVTGVGGSGKTRIVLQAAADLASSFPDGVWLVELAAISDPELVDSAVLKALDLDEPAGRSAIDVVLDHLQDRTALLLVDNCEHLIAAAADLIESLLRRLPDLTVVATSRELLGVPGEVAYGLRSMALPPEGAGPEAVLSSDAGRLFADRAAASRPGFDVTDENAAAIAEVCRRLDGMPLAVELAAARVRTFGPRQIAEHLDQRFRLLTGGSRTALPRQQTLTATIEWSYRLLDPSEQALFRRLSVFGGGFSFDAADAVCPGDPVDPLDMLELVPGLVDKSLVLVDDHGGDTRYRLLETLRQFARDRLAEAGESEAWRRRHAEHFARLAGDARPHLVGPDAPRWLRRLATDADNLRQAMTWALESDEVAMALDAGMGFLAVSRAEGRHSEAIRWMESIVAASEGLPDHRVAQARFALGSVLAASPRQDEAVRTLSEAVESYRRLADAGADDHELEFMPAAINNLALTLFHQGRGGERNELYIELVTEALRAAERLGNRHAVALMLANLAHHRDPDGDPEEARALFRAAEEAAREIHSTERLAGLATQRAFFEFAQDAFTDARRFWSHAADLADRLGLPAVAIASRAGVAASDAHLDDHTADTRFTAVMREWFDEADRREDLVSIQTFLAFRSGIAAARGRFEEVAVAHGAAQTIAEHGVELRWDLVRHAESARDAARSAMGRERYGELREIGTAMTREEIVGFLLGEGPAQH